MHENDTIAAVATAPGSGGIGIVRLSGTQSKNLLHKMFCAVGSDFSDFKPWTLHRGFVHDRFGRTLDDALVVYMPAPKTFTGEDVAELHCHGSPALLAAVLEELVWHGARLAERGEFSRRAFLNGRMDLSQAEAVAELVAAPSVQGARLALGKLKGLLTQRVEALREQLESVRAQLCLAVDFPEDEVEDIDKQRMIHALNECCHALQALLAGVERTRCWREGAVIALAGPVNAGKSSLLNALLGRERAIVTPLPGTTRDFLEERVVLNGLPVRVVDTAGLRDTTCCDAVEAAGIRMGQEQVQHADLVVVLVDGCVGLVEEHRLLVADLDPQKIVLVWNKADCVLPENSSSCAVWQCFSCLERVVVSARNGVGIEELAEVLRTQLLAQSGGGVEPDTDELAPNARQAHQLTQAHKALSALIEDMQADVPYELCVVRLEEAAWALAELIGLGTAEDVLNHIFESFCIGK